MDQVGRICLDPVLLFLFAVCVNVLCEAGHFEQADRDPVDVDLVPGQAVTCGTRVSMVVIVPAFAPGDRGDQAVVSRIVACLEPARSPQMSCGINQPRKVPADDGFQEYAPQDHRPAADREQGSGDDDGRDPVIFIDPLVKTIVCKIGAIPLHIGPRLILRFPTHYPAHVRPICAKTRAVRIAFGFGECMMDAVGRNPRERA